MEEIRIDPAKLEMFESMPIPRAVLKNAVPSIVSMLMVLVYNLADTFFIAQTHDDLQVAAVSLALPVFMVFLGLGNMLGAGGSSVISRALGAGRHDYASKVSAFCMWVCAGIGVLLMLVIWLFMSPLLRLIGASPETEGFAGGYLGIIASCGPLFLFSGCFSSIIRAEGQAATAMTGMLIGNTANIILDPIMILSLGWGIRGAAVATVISNIIGAVFYLRYFLRKKSILSISPGRFTVRDKVLTSVLAIGIPAALGNLLMSVSQMCANVLISRYSDLAVASLGVSMRVMMIIGTMCIGLGQGTQPLLGYCVGGRLWQRYKGIFRFSLMCSIIISSIMTCVCYLFTKEIVGVFLSGADALTLGVRFARIIMSTGVLFGIFYAMSSALQAVGAAGSTFIISISRQGLVYIPFLFIMNALVGQNGLVWAQPAADIISAILAVILYTIGINKRIRAC